MADNGWWIELLAYGGGGLVAALCAGLHYEALRGLTSARLERRGRAGVLILVVALLVVHVAEIWLFALAYWVGSGLGGAIEGASTLLDYAYFSAAVYTTLGFGDLIPHGALRSLAAAEALTGFAMITWSASFTFLAMQRMWSPE